MFCRKCGSQLVENALFCQKCGAKIEYEYDESQVSDSIKEETSSSESKSETMQEDEGLDQKVASEALGKKDSFIEGNKSKLKKWWDNCSTGGKVFVVFGIISLGIFVLWKFGYLLFGILMVGGFILSIFTGTKEEKLEARKTIVQLVVGGAIICIIALIIAFKPDLVFNIIQPGASVRNAYLSQYSENVTIEDAFSNYFGNEKWDTYKENGYSYVVFTGICEYMGEKADVRITFKIAGENFIIDSLDINGRSQGDWTLYLLLSEVYEGY